jgi:CRP-like cAMP-binding protein
MKSAKEICFDSLYLYLSRLAIFTDAEKQILERAFTFREVPKNCKLTEAGKIAAEVFFISRGLIHLYYDKDGEEITSFIFKEGLFASCYDSFLCQQPSIQTLETLERCQLLTIDFKQLQQLYNDLPKFNVIARKVTEQRFINLQMILSSFILDSPEERYRKFVSQHGDLLLRVKHSIIASYLGVTPVSLSRIRKRLL